jgi:ABC-2 type transport system permease protein
MSTISRAAGRSAVFSSALSDTLALSGRHVRHVRRAPGKLIGITLTPLVTLLVVGYLFKNSIVWPVQGRYQEYIMAGIAAQVGLASIGPTAIGVAMDLRGGLIDRFRSLPISRATVLIGHTLSDLIVAAISLCTVLVAGYALGWRAHDGVLPAIGAFGLLLAFTYAMLWIGVLLGLLVKNIETIQSVGALVLVLFTFLSTAFLGTRGMPGWVQPIAEWNPLSSVANACRHLWGNPVVSTGNDLPAQHASLATVISLATILLIALPISMRAYRNAVAH